MEKKTEKTPLPVIGITIGDPAGIGPEIVLKSLADPSLRERCVPLVIGDLDHLMQEADNLGIDAELCRWTKGSSDGESSNAVRVLDLGNAAEDVRHGVISAASGRAAAEYISAAVDLWKEGRIDAVATAPINKRSLSLGGFDYPGHTEFLAYLTGADDVRMSFMADRLRVVLLSTHVSLRKAIDLVTKDAVGELIRFTDRHLSLLLGKGVNLAVAGLNPHASEGGMFGTEEEDEIEPAIADCREIDGIEVAGPFSPDTVFLRAHKGEFDGVISCYHDQATIAVKCLSFGNSVNVTLGLPLIRTSVDHGTAFDIAGKNKADCGSLVTAIGLAAEFVSDRRNSSTNG